MAGVCEAAAVRLGDVPVGARRDNRRGTLIRCLMPTACHASLLAGNACRPGCPPSRRMPGAGSRSAACPLIEAATVDQFVPQMVNRTDRRGGFQESWLLPRRRWWRAASTAAR